MLPNNNPDELLMHIRSNPPLADGNHIDGTIDYKMN
jgi:hypothetical protein